VALAGPAYINAASPIVTATKSATDTAILRVMVRLLALAKPGPRVRTRRAGRLNDNALSTESRGGFPEFLGIINIGFGGVCPYAETLRES
jgi:hypothetical protein